MTAYEQELRRCKVVLLLRACIDAGGNMCAAAKSTGVHRNTMRRVLRAAGYDSRRIKQLTAEQKRKPAMATSAADSARRAA
jgi:hypothetical protein